MFGKKSSSKSGRDSSSPKASPRASPRSIDALPEVALAAIATYKKQKEVGDFMTFLLAALERNSEWLNALVGKQANFKCALMVGAGPNRFQLQEVIYPTSEACVKLEVELRDSEDYDKLAIAAILKLSNVEIDNLLRYMKTRLHENIVLRDDLIRGKAMGVTFAVLRPFSDKQYRVMERIIIGNSLKCLAPTKKRRRDEKSIIRSPLKRIKRDI
ncbi:uncharacterized protein LOC119833040 [Zerene cesonia]|uniref:uncharacterized protein LOC119833040 n=1 Tax=Zerene cesonia TaxID=33412 RepID=UPI0018E4FB8E|nr:uncharacterized protein LOC119833040 [Zerene cesonia]